MRKQKVLNLELPETAVVTRAEPLPKPGLPYWEIWRISLGRELDHVILSQQSFAVNTHYVMKSNRTTPCTLGWCGTCPLCGTIARRYQAFMAVAKTPSSTPSIVALPQLCVQAHPWVIRSENLFARHAKGRKNGRAHRSPISLTLGDPISPRPSSRLSVSWQELLEILCNIWGVEPPATILAGEGGLV